MGKKYIIELEDEPFTSGDKKLYKCKGFNSLVFDDNGIEILEKMHKVNYFEDVIHKYDLVVDDYGFIGFVLEELHTRNFPSAYYSVLWCDGQEKKVKAEDIKKYTIPKEKINSNVGISSIYTLMGYVDTLDVKEMVTELYQKKMEFDKTYNDEDNSEVIKHRYTFSSTDFKVGQILENIIISTCYDEVESVDLIVTRVTDDTVSFLPRYPFKTKHQMNDTNNSDGGYENSKMKKVILPKYENAFKEVFSSYKVLGLDLLNEDDVFGKDRLPLFNVNEDFINNEIDEAYDKNLIGSWSWWLRAVSASSGFAHVAGSGNAAYNGASYGFGVRPLLTLDLNSIREVLKKDNQ